MLEVVLFNKYFQKALLLKGGKYRQVFSSCKFAVGLKLVECFMKASFFPNNRH